MYETHFGLKRRPFRATPDPDSYYPATTHERALAQISQAFADDEGLALLTGEPGTGKTLIAQGLLDRLGEGYSFAFLTNAHFADRSALLQALLYDLGQEIAQVSEQSLRLELTEVLLNTFARGDRTLIVVDEAQHLNADLLEELRLLGNLESRRGKAVQTLLVGQCELRERLSLPELRVFDQRLALKACVEPLDVHESVDFLLHQLRAAGGRPDELISDEALELLAREAHGVPRLLNRLAHVAFGVAYQAEMHFVDAEVALEGLGRLGQDASAASDEQNGATVAIASEGIESHETASVSSLDEPATVICLGEGADSCSTSVADQSSGLRRIFAPPRRPA